MRWIAIFTDTLQMLAVRQQHAAAHLEFLAQHAGEILLAGGCRAEPEGDYIGGLWVMEVDSRARAESLIAQDPYYTSGARQYELRTWGKAFEDQWVRL